MDHQRLVRISKYLSLHLRHAPERIGVTLEPGGWVAIDRLLDAARRHGFAIRRDELEEVVARNDKQRFAIDAATDRIRAQQGHSVAVDLDLEPRDPPPTLYHGTVERALAAIRRDGLLKMRRHHVHLSPDVETATRVGARRGTPVILAIDSGAMAAAGFRFFRSGNGVWLVDRVPPEFLRIL